MNNTLKGSIYVMLGAASYGLLSTLVKLSYQNNFSTTEVISSQFLIGFVVLLLINGLSKNKMLAVSQENKKKLMLYGSSMGFTSVFYYLSVHYLNASVAVVLLMQSVWIGVLYESLAKKQRPSILKIIAIILVLTGTILATQFHKTINLKDLSLTGYVFGLLSAISFTTTLISTSNIANKNSATQRGFYMIIGGGVIIFIYGLLAQFIPFFLNIELLPQEFITSKVFNYNILWSFGIPLALFGTIIPPILLNKGFPLTGVGLGSIISSLELPTAACMAYVFLNETVNNQQWLGVVLIITSVLLINYKSVFKK